MSFGDLDLAATLVPKFNELYDKAQAVLMKYNPCNVSGGLCERGRRGGKNFCCQSPDCKYLGPKGCTVKSLRCVLSICSTPMIHESYRAEFKTAMWTIYIEALELNLLVTRGSMEDSIENACKSYHEGKGRIADTPKPVAKVLSTMYGVGNGKA